VEETRHIAAPAQQTDAVFVTTGAHFPLDVCPKFTVTGPLGTAEFTFKETIVPGGPLVLEYIPATTAVDMAAEIAIEVMCPATLPEFRIEARAGTRVVAGARGLVRVDASLRVVEIVTTDPGLLEGRKDGAPAYTGCEVVRDGELIGHTVSAVRARSRGRLQSPSPQ